MTANALLEAVNLITDRDGYKEMIEKIRQENSEV
jgi:hypothetical protein